MHDMWGGGMEVVGQPDAVSNLVGDGSLEPAIICAPLDDNLIPMAEIFS